LLATHCANASVLHRLHQSQTEELTYSSLPTISGQKKGKKELRNGMQSFPGNLAPSKKNFIFFSLLQFSPKFPFQF
jgi:hypothetical protein